MQNATLDNPGIASTDKILDGVTTDFISELKERPEVQDVGNVYIFDDYHLMDDESWKKIQERILSNERFLSEINEMYTGVNGIPTADEYLDMRNSEKELDGATYGISKMIFDKLEVVKTADGSDKLDWDKFNSGNYVLTTCCKDYDDDICIPYFEPGEVIQVGSRDEKYVTYDTAYGMSGEEFEIPNYDNEPAKEYEVYAVVKIPYAIRFQSFGEFQCDYILPEDEFLNLNGDRNPMRTLIDVKDDQEIEFEKWIDNYTSSINPDMKYNSKNTVLEEYKSFSDMLKVVGFTLSFILGIIGLLNFANTMISSIIVRARELAVLEAVGMTGKQQKIKLMKEGLRYFVWTSLFSIVVSILLNITAIKAFMNGMAMFSWQFTITPVLICLPIIGGLVAIIPLIVYARMCRESVVDRLRVE